MNCEAGWPDVDLTIRLDERKLNQVEFDPPSDQDCVR